MLKVFMPFMFLIFRTFSHLLWFFIGHPKYHDDLQTLNQECAAVGIEGINKNSKTSSEIIQSKRNQNSVEDELMKKVKCIGIYWAESVEKLTDQIWTLGIMKG